MTRQDARAHLRLVSPTPTEPRPVRREPEPWAKKMIQGVLLPHSREKLWLRMEPCMSGGMTLFYVRIVRVEDVDEYKPYLEITPQWAEEIVISKLVKLRKILRLFGIRPEKEILFNIGLLRAKLLLRDERLHKAGLLKQYFEQHFGI